MKQAWLNGVENEQYDGGKNFKKALINGDELVSEQDVEDFSKLDEISKKYALIELRKKLLGAYDEIKHKDEALDKKDHDLVMAAELGACLIEDNENLKKLCLKYTSSESIEQILLVPSKDSHNKSDKSQTRTIDSELQSFEKCKGEFEKQVEQLESKVDNLQEALLRKEAELKKLTDFKRTAERQTSNSNEERELLTNRLSDAIRSIKSLEDLNTKLTSEKSKLHETTSILQKKLEAIRNSPDITEELTFIKEQSNKLQSFKLQAEKEISDLTKAFDESKKTTKIRNAEIEELKNELERMIERQRNLEWELVSERELNSKLQMRFSSSEVNQDDSLGCSENSDNNMNNGKTRTLQKSLFNEVEDKRKELENKNNEIMRTHMAYVHRQEMLKDYIKKLLSLANFKNSDHRVRLLEDALGQSESERKELKTRYQILEKRLLVSEKRFSNSARKVAGITAYTDTHDYHKQPRSSDDIQENSDENIMGIESLEKECLIANNNALKEECANLKKEIRTLRVMNAGELEKLRSIESLLRDREDELVRTKASILKIKLELDTLKFKVSDSGLAVDLKFSESTKICKEFQSPGYLPNNSTKLSHTPVTFSPVLSKIDIATNNSINSSTGDTISGFLRTSNETGFHRERSNSFDLKHTDFNTESHGLGESRRNVNMDIISDPKSTIINSDHHQDNVNSDCTFPPSSISSPKPKRLKITSSNPVISREMFAHDNSI